MIHELRAIQDQHGYIPEAALRDLARDQNVPLYHLHGLATFYPHFRLEPPRRLEVQVCRDLPCYMQGAPDLTGAARRLAQDVAGEDCRIEGVSCLGRCDGAPALAVNGCIFSHAGRGALLDAVRRGGTGPIAEPPLPAPRHPEALIDPYEGEDQRYRGLRTLLTSGDDRQAIAALKASGLRGMGGAGFPTARKWEIVRDAPGGDKLAICNADESEPGTFKDRYVMQAYPHLVWEGLLVGAAVVGARRAIIYIRHEYEQCREALEAEREALEASGLLERFPCQLEVFVSPGGYICGEETALLEALEGRRAEPRNRPPFPATHGLHGRPTLINNVETFAFVPLILDRGGAWFARQGVNGAQGLKYLALSGDVKRPGVYEVPLGVSARDFIERYGGGVAGGRALKAFLPGGTSSGFLPASMVDLPLDFQPLAAAGSMLGSGAVVAVAEGRDMLDLGLNALRFFRNESCGKCVPCRAGSEKLVTILEGVRDGGGSGEEPQVIRELAETMIATSICGLGQVAPLPVTSVLQHFPAELPAALRPSAGGQTV